MIKIVNKKARKAICIVTVMAFLSNCCLPTAIAGGLQQNDQLSKFILDLTGGCSAEEILDIIKTTTPISDAAADEILFALNGLLATTLYGASEIKPAQSSACSSAALLFMTGLTFVLFSGIISGMVEQQECEDQRCLGNYCVCRKTKDPTILEQANDILFTVGNAIIILGVLGYVQNCLLNPGESVVDTISITQ